MSKKQTLNPNSISTLAPGCWVWDRGVGYRRHNTGNGGTWYIKYRAPIPGHYAANISPPMKQVKERLPNCRNKSQAEGVLMARKAAIFEGTYQPKKRAEPNTLSSFAPQFLDTKRHLRTVKKYRQQLNQHIIPHFGNKQLEAIGGQDVIAYYNQRLDTDAAISTVNGELACLKSFFSEVVKVGIVTVNPVRGIKLQNPNNVRDRLLSSDEAARLFAAAMEFPDFVRPLFHVLYHTGMRLGEALALQWSDIETEHARIVIRRSKSGEGRKVPLRDVLQGELIRWQPRTSGSQWLFPARYDASKPMQSIRKGWLRLCGEAQVSNFKPHDLRHNFTSQLQAAGVSDSTIMAITGHKTHVMLHRYSHAADASKVAAVEALPVPVLKPSDNIVRLEDSPQTRQLSKP